jgi:2-phospho-L-lactate guanylyltransferase
VSTPTHAAATADAHVVLAVKDLLHAKTRLAGTLPAEGRAALVLAMLADTLNAAQRSPEVAAVHVVTRDESVASVARRCGAAVIADPPTAGLNPALEHAASAVGARRMVALQPDLPALRPSELSAVLAEARLRAQRCFTVDRDGTGTTMLSGYGGALQALFGVDSAAHHQRSGAQPLAGSWPGLRCDVDTLADLAAALRLGVGPATGAVLDGLGTPATVAGHTEGAVLLRGDDGATLFCADAAAKLGGWRQLRPGQRVRAHRDEEGRVVLVTPAATNAPG